MHVLVFWSPPQLESFVQQVAHDLMELLQLRLCLQKSCHNGIVQELLPQLLKFRDLLRQQASSLSGG